MRAIDKRRRSLLNFLAGMGGLLASGCDRLSRSPRVAEVLGSVEPVNHALHRLILPRDAMAQEFSANDISPEFRSNGTSDPETLEYQRLKAGGFADWRLTVAGLVERPLSLSLSELRKLPSRTQITRHDCVEGWSAIGQWTGVPLGIVLALARAKRSAQFVVFHCADLMEGTESSRYYESIDMEDATHPQTILAYALNGAPLPIPNGAPLRLRVERQLGYKMAKFVMRLELVSSLDEIGGGNGGFWEDRGYEWYAGI